VAVADAVFASIAWGPKLLELLSGVCDLSSSGYKNRRTSLLERVEQNPNYNVVSKPVLSPGPYSPNPMNEPVYVPHPNTGTAPPFNPNDYSGSETDSGGPKNFPDVSDDKSVDKSVDLPTTPIPTGGVPTKDDSDSFNSDVDKPQQSCNIFNC